MLRANLAAKRVPSFLEEVRNLLRPGVAHDPAAALDWVDATFIPLSAEGGRARHPAPERPRDRDIKVATGGLTPLAPTKLTSSSERWISPGTKLPRPTSSACRDQV
jgi:hypothetical protein